MGDSTVEAINNLSNWFENQDIETLYNKHYEEDIAKTLVFKYQSTK